MLPTSTLLIAHKNRVSPTRRTFVGNCTTPTYVEISSTARKRSSGSASVHPCGRRAQLAGRDAAPGRPAVRRCAPVHCLPWHGHLAGGWTGRGRGRSDGEWMLGVPPPAELVVATSTSERPRRRRRRRRRQRQRQCPRRPPSRRLHCRPPLRCRRRRQNTTPTTTAADEHHLDSSCRQCFTWTAGRRSSLMNQATVCCNISCSRYSHYALLTATG